MLFFSLFSSCQSVSLFLVNPTRCRQLFTPGRTPGEERRCARHENLTRKTTRHNRRCLCYKRHSSHFSSPQSRGNSEMLQKMQHQHASPAQQEWEWEAEWFTYVDQSGFLSVQLIKIPRTKNAGCDVRRAGGVGLICMSGPLLHLQIGSHWACLSAPLAALLAYGATEGIHEHSSGVGLSTH